MKINYQVRIQKLTKYTGLRPDEVYIHNEIKEEDYHFTYESYKEALKDYQESIMKSANQILMPICFTQQHIIQLLNFEENGKRRILFQFTCSSI